jgi:hypothetical protein
MTLVRPNENPADTRKNVEWAKRWRDASPIERIDIQIEDEQQYARQMMAAGAGSREFLREHTNQIEKLRAERTKLARASG